MSSSNWRDGEIWEMLTLMGDKGMQSHLTPTGKDVAKYEKVPEELSLGGFCRDQNNGLQNNMFAFFTCKYLIAFVAYSQMYTHSCMRVS